MHQLSHSSQKMAALDVLQLSRDMIPTAAPDPTGNVQVPPGWAQCARDLARGGGA
jgi:hypothetical protein